MHLCSTANLVRGISHSLTSSDLMLLGLARDKLIALGSFTKDDDIAATFLGLTPFRYACVSYKEAACLKLVSRLMETTSNTGLYGIYSLVFFCVVRLRHKRTSFASSMGYKKAYFHNLFRSCNL